MAVIAVGDIEVPKVEQSIRSLFTPLKARAAAAKAPDDTVPLHKELLVAVTTDPEVTRSTVTVVPSVPPSSALSRSSGPCRSTTSGVKSGEMISGSSTRQTYSRRGRAEQRGGALGE